MANIFVRSTDGSDLDNGSTWALAKATLKAVGAIEAAGDSVYVSQAHAETSSDGDLRGIAAGTNGSPVKVIGANDAAEPPTAVSTAPTLLSTGGWTFPAGGLYVYGLQFSTGSGAVNNTIDFMGVALPLNVKQLFEKCQFIQQATGGAAVWQIGALSNNGPGIVEWRNCDIKAASTNNRIGIIDMVFQWRGGSVLAGGTAMTTLLQPNGTSRPGNCLVESVDLSQLASTCNLVDFASAGTIADVLFRYCKLPASWTGSLATGLNAPGQRAEMHNCDNADTNYRLWVEDFLGSIKHETTLVRTGGANDGATTLAWKMASNTNAVYPMLPLRTPEMRRWQDAVGSAITVTVDVLHDSVTNLKDDEIWLEVQYLGTSGVPLGSLINDAKADVLATAADQAASSSTWTTTGMTNPNKQKLSVTFTPQEKGYLIATVHLAKASYTVYVDPKLQVS